MIDTFALFGKSTWEKILLPKLFKQTMVKFSFLVTNLTFQGSDSSLAERGRNWCLLGVLDLQILPGVPWIWECGPACPCDAALCQGRRVMAEHGAAETNEGGTYSGDTLLLLLHAWGALLKLCFFLGLSSPLAQPQRLSMFDSLEMAGEGKGFHTE